MSKNILALTLLLGCGGPQVLYVDLTAVEPDAAWLRLSVSPDEGPAIAPRCVALREAACSRPPPAPLGCAEVACAPQDADPSRTSRRVGLELPSGLRGRLFVSAEAYAAPTCFLGSGQAGVQVGEEPRIEVQASLYRGTDFCWESPLPMGFTMNALWGTSEDEVWAAGEQGTVWRRHAGRWELHSLGTTEALWGIWLDRPDNVWVVGGGGLVRRWDGARWEAVRCEGWTPQGLRAVWGSGQDVWAAGANATLLHFREGTCANETGAVQTGTLFSLWGSGPEDVWAVGQMPDSKGVTLHREGASWGRREDPADHPYGWRTVWGSGPGDVWRASPSRLEHWGGRGEDWKPIKALDKDRVEFTQVHARAGWSFGPDEVWLAYGHGYLLRLRAERQDGALQLVVQGAAGGGMSATDPGALWGAATGALFAGGEMGRIRRFTADLQCADPRACWDISRKDAPQGGLSAYRRIFTTPAGNSWIAGDRGTLLRWDGERWQQEPILSKNGSDLTGAPSIDLRALWGHDDQGLWAASERGVYVRQPDGRWRAIWEGTGPLALWGTGPDEVWGVWGNTDSENMKSWGHLLRCTQAACDAPQMLDPEAALVGIAGSGAALWAVGGKWSAGKLESVLWRYDPDKKWRPDPPSPPLPLSRVWSDGRDLWGANSQAPDRLWRRPQGGTWKDICPQNNPISLRGHDGAIFVLRSTGLLYRVPFQDDTCDEKKPRFDPISVTARFFDFWPDAGGGVRLVGNGSTILRHLPRRPAAR